MTKVIAINNQKGGVAKTTTCLSLGACLVEMGYTVLLIDLDPQAHLTLSLGLQPEKIRRTIGDVLLANSTLMGASRESGIFDLDIVPANQDVALVDKLLYGQAGYEYKLKERLMASQQEFYEFILIDCPPAFNTLTLNALTAANLLMIPVQCEYYAARSLSQIMRVAKLVQTKSNPCLVYQLLITMYDRRNKICRLIFDHLEQQMKDLLYQTIIEVDTKLKESPVFGQPITHYASETRAAEQYRLLAKELVESWQTKTLKNNSQACSTT